jgi:hypothetical protein
MTIGDTEGLLSIAARQGMMQNKISWFRVAAMANLFAGNWKGLDCLFAKHSLAEPSGFSSRAPVCEFSILACLQELVRQCGKPGLPVTPILLLCAGSTEEVFQEVRWVAGEAGSAC